MSQSVLRGCESGQAGRSARRRSCCWSRAQFDDTVALLKEADARSELLPFLRQSLTDLLRTLGMPDQLASAR